MRPRSWFRIGIRTLTFLAALAFLSQIAMGLFGIPPRLLGLLSPPELQVEDHPRYLIVLGGGGIPSESGLMRTYFAATLGLAMTGTTTIVSLPTDEDPETSSVGLMRDELVMRGIPADSIRMEYQGVNTHEQAVRIREMLEPGGTDESIMIVTSPTHLRRAVLCFRKEGFESISARSAVPVGHEADPGALPGLRYAFWANLELQVRMARELCALGYYRIRGWI